MNSLTMYHPVRSYCTTFVYGDLLFIIIVKMYIYIYIYTIPLTYMYILHHYDFIVILQFLQDTTG